MTQATLEDRVRARTASLEYEMGLLHTVLNKANELNETDFPDLLIDIIASKNGNKLHAQLRGSAKCGNFELSDADETYGKSTECDYTELSFSVYNGCYKTAAASTSIVRKLIEDELDHQNLSQVSWNVKYCIGELVGNIVERGKREETFDVGIRIYNTHVVAWITEKIILPEYQEPDFEKICTGEEERGRGRWMVRQKECSDIVVDEIQCNETTTMVYWDLTKYHEDSQRMQELFMPVSKAA